MFHGHVVIGAGVMGTSDGGGQSAQMSLNSESAQMTLNADVQLLVVAGEAVPGRSRHSVPAPSRQPVLWAQAHGRLVQHKYR
jgi:hypothetical protein